MGAFADTFKDACTPTDERPYIKTISDEHFGDITADPDKVKALKLAMEKDGLLVDHLIGGDGHQSLVFRMQGSKTGALRIDPVPVLTEVGSKSGVNFDPLDDSIVLKPVIRKNYGDYIVSVLPFGENAGKLSIEDFLRTVSVLEHHGKTGYREQDGKQVYFTHFIDASPNQLMNLKDDDGKLMSYPDGKPVGFIHDSNAAVAEPGTSDKTSRFGTPPVYIEPLLADLKRVRADLNPESKYQQKMIAKYRTESDKGKEIKEDDKFLDYLIQLLERATALNELKEIRANLDPGNQQQQKAIARYRAESTTGKEIKDDDKFLDHHIQSLETGLGVSRSDADAPRQQAVAAERLRTELLKLDNLSPDLKAQINQRSDWEKTPSRIADGAAAKAAETEVDMGRDGAKTQKTA